VVQGDLGTSIRTGRPVDAEIGKAVGNTLMLAALATLIGFVLGTLFGFVAGYFRDTWIDKAASAMSVFGVSVPHYWLGMVLVIIFSATLGWLVAREVDATGHGGWEGYNWLGLGLWAALVSGVILGRERIAPGLRAHLGLVLALLGLTAIAVSFRIGLGGALPVTTHGGLLSGGHPGLGGGFFHVLEGVRQVRGDAGERQVPDAKVALVHGNGGVISVHCTLLLGSEGRA
jgi:ABC-type dipeptide/oligopeptide/nickel transport system permease subunit